jgi:hypothetical protein
MSNISKRPLDGSPVFDATNDLLIEVVKNDVAKADQKDPADCAMARAVRRCTKAHEVRAHLGRVYVRQREKGPWKRYETGPALRSEIISFDRGGGFQEGQYMLKSIRPAHKLSARKKWKAGANRNSKLRKTKRIAPHTFKNVRGGPIL